MRSLAVVSLLFCGSLYATNTLIQDTAYYPFNNQPASCTMVYQLMAGQASAGSQTLISVPKNYQVLRGVVNLSLVPNDQIAPAGSYYQISSTCFVDGGMTPAGTETWVVPTSATPLTVRAVRAGVPVPGPGSIAIQQVSCTGCLPGQAPVWNGLSFQAGAVLLSPMSNLGDSMYGGAGGAIANLPGDTSNARKLLRTQAVAGVAQAPAWDFLISSDISQALGYTPPSSGGSGASGTWSISITGTAASAQPSGSAGGDLCSTSTYPAPLVCAVGGSTAANVHAAELLANGAAAANTAAAIVRRDASGNFAAGVVTAALAGNASTASALAAAPSSCAAGAFASGVSAAGNATGCTALPTTIAGTLNQILASGATGAVVLSFPPAGVTLPGTTSGTFLGNLTGNASGTAAGFTGSLAGDTTSAGMLTTTLKVNGVAFPSGPALHATPVISAANNAIWSIINDCFGGGKHLTFVQSTNAFGCDATAGTAAGVDFGAVTGTAANPNALLVSGSLAPSGSGTVTASDVNGVHLAGLATGLLKLTAGVPSIAVAADLPSLTGLYAIVGRNINTSGPLSGGGNLSADLNLSIAIAGPAQIGAENVAGTANQINVSYLAGTATLSFPAGGVTLPGSTAGTFSGTINNLIVTPQISSPTLNISAGKSVSIANSISFAVAGGVDGVSYYLPSSSAQLASLGANVFTGRQDSTTALSTAPFKTGTVNGLPTACLIGDQYFATDATPGQQRYQCATNPAGGANLWRPEAAPQFLFDVAPGGTTYSLPGFAAAVSTAMASIRALTASQAPAILMTAQQHPLNLNWFNIGKGVCDPAAAYGAGSACPFANITAVNKYTLGLYNKGFRGIDINMDVAALAAAPNEAYSTAYTGSISGADFTSGGWYYKTLQILDQAISYAKGLGMTVKLRPKPDNILSYCGLTAVSAGASEPALEACMKPLQVAALARWGAAPYSINAITVITEPVGAFGGVVTLPMPRQTNGVAYVNTYVANIVSALRTQASGMGISISLGAAAETMFSADGYFFANYLTQALDYVGVDLYGSVCDPAAYPATVIAMAAQWGSRAAAVGLSIAVEESAPPRWLASGCLTAGGNPTEVAGLEGVGDMDYLGTGIMGTWLSATVHYLSSIGYTGFSLFTPQPLFWATQDHANAYMQSSALYGSSTYPVDIMSHLQEATATAAVVAALAAGSAPAGQNVQGQSIISPANCAGTCAQADVTSNAGLNVYTGNTIATYCVTMLSGSTLSWGTDVGCVNGSASTSVPSPAGTPLALTSAVTITFGHTGGYTTGDTYYIAVWPGLTNVVITEGVAVSGGHPWTVQNAAHTLAWTMVQGMDLWGQNAIPATAGANQSSLALHFSGTAWHAGASVLDQWNFQDVVGAGTDPTSVFTLAHSCTGCTGGLGVSLPSLQFSEAAPSVICGAGAGTTPTCGTPTGSGSSWQWTLTEGTPTATGVIATFTFARAHAAAPIGCQIQGTNGATTSLGIAIIPHITSLSATGFAIVSGGTGLTAGGNFSWSGFCF